MQRLPRRFKTSMQPPRPPVYFDALPWLGRSSSGLETTSQRWGHRVDTMRLRVRVTNLFCLFIATALAGTGWIVKAEALTAGHATAHIIGVKVALAGIADFTGAGGDRHRITAYGHGRSFQLYWVKENHSTLQYRCNIFILNNLHLTKHVSCALCTVFRMGG